MDIFLLGEDFFINMKQFIKQHKYFIAIFLVSTVIAVISGYQNFKIPNSKSQISNKIQKSNEQNTTTDSKEQIITKKDEPQEVIISPRPSINPNQEGNPTTTPSSTDNGSMIQWQNLTLAVTSTSTVYELMKNSQINFKTKTFPGMGEFVEEINGLKNDTQAGKYWIYYVNGESAKLGISTQIVKPNDIITWKYENANF